MRAELSLEHIKAAQGTCSSLHGLDDCRTCSSATLYAVDEFFATFWKTHSDQLLHASGSVLLIISSNFHGFVARYTINKLDTSSNGSARLVYVHVTISLGFLNHINLLDSLLCSDQ